MAILRDILSDRETTLRFFSGCNLDSEVTLEIKDTGINIITTPTGDNP